jgi:DNA processing protein
VEQLKKMLIELVHGKQSSWKSIYSVLKSESLLDNINEEKIISSYNPRNSRQTYSEFSPNSVDKLLVQYTAQKIHLITFFDNAYPEALKTIYQPPWVIFAKGDLSLLNSQKSLAVVGSRDASKYGFDTIDYLFPELIQSQTIIISGLAKGIDAHAHKTAIRLGGKTLGVIAGGFNKIYPKENIELAQFMMQNHLVLSEYPPDARPEKWHFPMRNRIISGLAKGTLIIEAQKRSGSLITAEYALNEGREVFAVPGSILSPHSEGVHELIQQGAKLIKNSGEILEELKT